MPTSAGDVLCQVPIGLAATRGPEHVLELLNPAAHDLLAGSGLLLDGDLPVDGDLAGGRGGRPLRELLPGIGGQALVEAADRTYRDGAAHHATAEATINGSGRSVRVACSPLRDADGAVCGVALHVEATATAGEAGARVRGAALLQLAEELSRAATPSAIGRLTITTAAGLLGADGAGVYTPVPGGAELERVHSAGWPTSTIEQYRRVELTRGRPLSDAVLDATPIWLEDLPDWRARYPEMAPVPASAGYEATACLPLRVEDRDLGAVVFSFLAARAFTPDERDYLLAVAALCAQALDRARLYVAEQAARVLAERQLARMTFLAEANQLMEAPLSVEQRLQRLADLAVPGLADWCVVHLVRADRVDQVAVAHVDPEKVAFVARLQERYPVDPDAPGGAIQVSRTGVPLFMPEIPDALLVEAARDAEHLALLRDIGMSSVIAVPLVVRGRSLGALTLVHAESGERFDELDLAFARQLGASAALALDNARLYEQQQQVAHTLQTALLPAVLPTVPGLALAARYRPQSDDLADVYVGGDLYDVVAGDAPGLWSVTVGDVCGKGPEAAALTALIRHTMAAEVTHGSGPVEVLRRVNTAMLRQSGSDEARFATVVHGHLATDSAGATVALVSAGHLPPLVLRGSDVETVAAPGTLLGVYPDLALTEVQVRLGRGDVLVLYTDGVTEARGVAGFYGTERLVALLASCAGLPADEVADTLLADVLSFQDGRLRDDVAILAVQVTP